MPMNPFTKSSEEPTVREYRAINLLKQLYVNRVQKFVNLQMKGEAPPNMLISFTEPESFKMLMEALDGAFREGLDAADDLIFRYCEQADGNTVSGKILEELHAQVYQMAHDGRNPLENF